MRKPPVRHPVREHTREGKHVRDYERGKGQKPQRSSRVVGKRDHTNYYRKQYLELDNNFREPKKVSQVPEKIWEMAYLNEKTDTPEENFLRYIDVTYLDCPTLDNMRDDPEYFRKNKGTVFEIKLVSPDKYFRLAAEVHGHGNASRERGNVSEERARKYADKMSSGDKFPLPYIDFDYGNQEGRNRARALEILGVKWVPVMIVKSVDS